MPDYFLSPFFNLERISEVGKKVITYYFESNFTIKCPCGLARQYDTLFKILDISKNIVNIDNK